MKILLISEIGIFSYIYLMSLDKNLKTILLKIGNKYRKKEYDGSYKYTVYVSDKDFNEIIELENIFINTYNYITLVYQDYFIFIDKNSYKQEILNYIN